jgi:hypothetical protein
VRVTSVVNINDVLDGHVVLEVECVDRMLLNAYVPCLQVGGQVVRFLTEHLGFPIPSPTLFNKIGNRFRREVKSFADEHKIPILSLKKPDRTRWDDRKLDHVRPHLERAERDGRFGVVAIVATQEFQWVFGATNRSNKPGIANFDFVKQERRVGTYYFYILDPEFGPGFIKICTYFPYPAKVWVNGHEWAKHQADHDGVAYTSLANGFEACDAPEVLQAICDRFGPDDVQGFFDRWIAVIPTPFTAADRAAGYWWELSMRQVEVSRTLVFDDPRRARGFFEALVADNIGIGRPQEVHAVFGRDPRGRTTSKQFRTRVFGPGTDVKMDFAYKHSRVKQYLKEGRALRIETVVNKPGDIGVLARLEHLPELIAKARAVNHRLLMIERAGQGCAIGDDLFDRLHQPLTEGQRTGALRFGEPRAMALAGALCAMIHAVTGFTNKSLRGRVAGLLDADYGANQMGYDLRRLRLHGLIERIPNTNTYRTTPDGVRVAVFYTKIHQRLLRPLIDAADQPPAPVELRRALHTIERTIDEYIDHARLGTAA